MSIESVHGRIERVRIPSLTSVIADGASAVLRRHLLILIILLAWEIAVRSGAVSSVFLPPPSRIIARLTDALFVSQDIWRHVLTSFYRLCVGLLFAAVIGSALGIFMGAIDRVYRALATTVEVLRPIPAIALIPFAIFYLGIGDASKIFLIAYGAVFPILLNTIAGMRDSDRVLVNAGLVLGATNAQIIMRIRVPTALPYILAGFRISVGLGLVVLVASEMVGATRGIGFYILNSEMTWRIEDMFTGITLLSLIGVSANWLLLRLEARVLKWR